MSHCHSERDCKFALDIYRSITTSLSVILEPWFKLKWTNTTTEKITMKSHLLAVMENLPAFTVPQVTYSDSRPQVWFCRRLHCSATCPPTAVHHRKIHTLQSLTVIYSWSSDTRYRSWHTAIQNISQASLSSARQTTPTTPLWSGDFARRIRRQWKRAFSAAGYIAGARRASLADKLEN